jgi:Tyrosine phosphatase family
MTSQLSPEKLEILLSPPFVNVEGVINMRDAGGQLSSVVSGARVRRGYIFRAGEPSHITDRGKDQLCALGVKIAFDLRSAVEIERYDAAPLMIDGIDFVHTPISRTESYDPVSLASRVKGFETNITDVCIHLLIFPSYVGSSSSASFARPL